MGEFFIQALFSYLATVAFGIITNVPRRVLHVCGVTGMTGWLVYWLLHHQGNHLLLANFSGAVVIGVLSVFFARWKKMPMTIFNIPSLVPLVPGGPAYQAVRYIVMDNYPQGIQEALNVLLIAGSIACGFVVVNTLEQLLKRSRHYRQSKKR